MYIELSNIISGILFFKLSPLIKVIILGIINPRKGSGPTIIYVIDEITLTKIRPNRITP